MSDDVSLATKYRPKLFKDFIGNEDTVASIQAILKRNKVPHSILFVGPSGGGKTTLARIIARKLNCSKHDFQELNAADFRGIDSVRDIIRQMLMNPITGSTKVWLMDECHMLTNEAQNAILKAIEEPPKHVYFLLATTNPEKLLPTMRTRLPTFTLKALPEELIMELLGRVVEKEGEKVPKKILEQIAQDSLGSCRAALSILEKILGLDEAQMLRVAKQQAEEQSETLHLCRALLKGEKWSVISKILRGLEGDAENIRRAVLGYMRSVLIKSEHEQAYQVMAAFRQDFFSSGKDGLVIACYEATH